MKKVFLFRNVRIDSAKVSHALAVGLPSLTGLTGLATAFAAELAVAAGLTPSELTSNGVLLAFDNYHLHEGYKKASDKAGSKVATRALVSAYASFNAHLIFEVTSETIAGMEVLGSTDLVDISRDTLRTLRLCGASLGDASRPTRINAQKAEELGGERYAALAALPSKARVLVSAAPIVQAMREDRLPLMEGLIAATLRPSQRPGKFRDFFEKVRSQNVSGFDHTYGVVQDGYLLVGDAGGRLAGRLTFAGDRLPVQVGSPLLSLVRLQSAASLRSGSEWEDGTRPSDDAFWRMYPFEGGFACRPSS